MRRVLLIVAAAVAGAALAQVPMRVNEPGLVAPAAAPPAPEADPTYWPTVDGTPCGDRLPDK